jgi:hypothetical protein
MIQVTATLRKAFANMNVYDLALWTKLIKASNLRPG